MKRYDKITYDDVEDVVVVAVSDFVDANAAPRVDPNENDEVVFAGSEIVAIIGAFDSTVVGVDPNFNADVVSLDPPKFNENPVLFEPKRDGLVPGVPLNAGVGVVFASIGVTVV